MKKYFLSALLLLSLSACSLGELTVKASMPMIEGGLVALNREPDLQLAEDSMPANIELMEGMLVNAPDNRALRNYAAQAYYGYAYGFIEAKDEGRAIAFYQRGLKHALYNLHRSGIDRQLLEGDLTALDKALQDTDSDDVPALFWAASNWARWIDHNRDQPEAIADLARAVLMMQRVLELDETYYMAGPHLFFAVYYGSRSPMLGGNFVLSEKHFDRARQLNKGQLLLVDVLQAEYLDRQKFDQPAFHQRLVDVTEFDSTQFPELALVNRIAQRKAHELLKKESEWF